MLLRLTSVRPGHPANRYISPELSNGRVCVDANVFVEEFRQQADSYVQCWDWMQLSGSCMQIFQDDIDLKDLSQVFLVSRTKMNAAQGVSEVPACSLRVERN